MAPANERVNDGDAVFRTCILRSGRNLDLNQSANKGVSYEQG